MISTNRANRLDRFYKHASLGTILNREIQPDICHYQIRNLYLLIGFLFVTPFSTFFAFANALPSEDEIMAKIDREAERINDIMNQKIQNHPGLSDFDGYCYNSVEALEQCQNEIANDMQPYYDEAGERIWDSID